MSLEINLSNLATRIGTEFKAVRGTLGNNADLQTTAKSTLVAAINEIYAGGGSGGGGTEINDAAVNLTQTWSSQRSTDAIAAAVAALVDSAPDLLDTLGELAAALGDDPNFASTVTAQIAGKADVVHTHTASQISDSTATGRALITAASVATARTTLDVYSKAEIGNPEADLVAVFNAAIA